MSSTTSILNDLIETLKDGQDCFPTASLTVLLSGLDLTCFWLMPPLLAASG